MTERDISGNEDRASRLLDEAAMQTLADLAKGHRNYALDYAPIILLLGLGLVGDSGTHPDFNDQWEFRITPAGRKALAALSNSEYVSTSGPSFPQSSPEAGGDSITPSKER